MKRKIIAAIFTGMLTAALFPAIAHAEIENPEDYMGIWYANYVIYSDESSERHNVAEYLNQYLEMRLMEDGSAYHQYQPLTKRGNSDIGSGFNDDPLWLIAAVAAYIKETGDYSILEESVPFDNKE